MATIERSADLAMVGANGGGWSVDLGSTGSDPGDPATAPAAPWLPLGAISDDGLVSGFDEDSESFTPWGLSSPFRTQITSSVRTFQVTLWETQRAICKSLMYRKALSEMTRDTTTGVRTFSESGSPKPDRRSFVFDVMDGDVIERFYVPAGEVTERDDVTYAQGEMSGFVLTITAYPDDAGNTIYHYDNAPAESTGTT